MNSSVYINKVAPGHDGDCNDGNLDGAVCEAEFDNASDEAWITWHNPSGCCFRCTLLAAMRSSNPSHEINKLVQS